MPSQVPLRERKRRRAKAAIVDAAFALFAERGFAEVSVGEIAERAEVGRTSFFRYFGDKQEVLFADEQDLVDGLLSTSPATRGTSPPTFGQAVRQARAAVDHMCATVTADSERYRLHEELIAGNPELHDRSERKLLHLTDAMATVLRAQGMPAPEATLAAHVALACFRAAKAMTGSDPEPLQQAVDAAFDTVLRRL